MGHSPCGVIPGSWKPSSRRDKTLESTAEDRALFIHFVEILPDAKIPTKKEDSHERLRIYKDGRKIDSGQR